MNTEQLNRGKEIQADIARLKSSLSELIKARIFNVNEEGCFAYSSQQANPFLADLEVKTRSFASTAITNKIKSLETEFKQL